MTSGASCMFLLLTFTSILHILLCDQDTMEVGTAIVSVSYRDPENGENFKQTDNGRYGYRSAMETKYGDLIHVRTLDNKTRGCSSFTNAPNEDEAWIALIERGECSFDSKIHNAAIVHHASAVVVYDHEEADDILIMNHKVEGVVVVSIKKAYGDKLAGLVDSQIRVVMNISLGKLDVYNVLGDVTSGGVIQGHTHIKNNTMVGISLCLVGILLIGIILLLVYIVRRARYINARNSPHMMNVAVRNDEVLLSNQEESPPYFTVDNAHPLRNALL